jgi:hypothetical protein
MPDLSYQKIFSEVCLQDVEDDGLSFLSETIRVERIRDEEAYEGVRVRLEARLGNVRIPLQIDVGFGDAIVPAPKKLEFPTLLEFPAPKLNAYPKESVVAEKFEAIVKLGMANSRMKDFYDLWVLAQRFQFESATLAAAIQATFATRETVLPILWPLALQTDFYKIPSKQTQWKAFLRKSGLNAGSSLEATTRVICEFLMPVVEGISKGDRERRLGKQEGCGNSLPLRFSGIVAGLRHLNSNGK